MERLALRGAGVQRACIYKRKAVQVGLRDNACFLGHIVGLLVCILQRAEDLQKTDTMAKD